MDYKTEFNRLTKEIERKTGDISEASRKRRQLLRNWRGDEQLSYRELEKLTGLSYERLRQIIKGV
jgi:ATP-dependent protease HslVU (ClpYQ) peptidase subunit